MNFLTNFLSKKSIYELIHESFTIIRVQNVRSTHKTYGRSFLTCYKASKSPNARSIEAFDLS